MMGLEIGVSFKTSGRFMLVLFKITDIMRIIEFEIY